MDVVKHGRLFIVQMFSQIVKGFLFMFTLVHKVHIVLLKMEVQVRCVVTM